MAERDADGEPVEDPGEPAGLPISNTILTTETPCLVNQLNSFIDDDVYRQLKKHFLKKGKGRPPDLPQVTILTNRLLLQLHFLKEENDSSVRQVKEWLEKLMPNTATVSDRRIYHRVQAILHKCSEGITEEVDMFLQQEYDFHKLSDPLAALGLNRLHITGIENYGHPASTDATIEVFVELEKLRAQEQETQTFVHKWMKTLSLSCRGLTDPQMKRMANKSFKIYRHLSKNQRTKSNELFEFLKKPFVSNTNTSSVTVKKEETHSSLTSTKLMCSKECPNLIKLNKKKKLIERNLKDEALRESITLKVQIEEREKLLEVQPKIELQNEHLESKVKRLKIDLKAARDEKNGLQDEVESIKKSKLYKSNLKHKQILKSIAEERDLLQKEIHHAQIEKQELSSAISKFKTKVKMEQSLKSKYKNCLIEQKVINNDLKNMLQNDADEHEISVRDQGSSHRYSDHVRKTFYALQGEANVAAGNCSKVIDTVAKHLFDKELGLSNLPCPSTSLNFASEAHIIAKHQVVSEINKNDHFTYASDGTSRQKAHYLEQHLVLSGGKTLSLGFQDIACDDSQTLLEKCVGIFKDISEIYCLDSDTDKSMLLKDIIRKLKCLLSDRAAVNKAFDAKMANYKNELLGADEDSSVHFIFCNAHFLLALSAAAKEAIGEVEKESLETGDKLGRDANSAFIRFSSSTECAAIRLIRTAADILGPRGDEKNGCRQEWLAFCSSLGIISFFTSYRDNRFNNLFQNATALIRHRKDIDVFLHEHVTHSNLKLQSVLADLRDPRIVSNIAVLSFFHIFLTEPYWQLLNSTKSYADFPNYVKKMKSVLVSWGSHSGDFSLVASSVFDDFEEKESDVSVWKEFFSSNEFDSTVFNTCLKRIAKKCENALNRQLVDFLEGGVFGGEINESVKSILRTCPLTNLTGERLFGDLDFCMKKRRNTSLHLRSTTNMLKHNKTAKWLNKQSRSMSQKLLKKAIKYGPVWKKKYKMDKKAVQDKIKATMAQHKRYKDEQEFKKNENKLAAIDAILVQGASIAQTKEQLDALYNGPQAVLRLKEQIRFRKLVRGETIALSGNKKMLYSRLLAHINK